MLAEHKEAALWRALAYARQGKWVQAREGFKSAEAVITTLPIELQRAALKERLRAAIEVRDLGDATQTLNELMTIGVPGEMEAATAVLSGRLAEALGRISDALNAYHSAAEAGDRPAAAQARLREILLRYSLKKLARTDAISELEVLTTVWRGDETEIEALELLGHLYIEEQRYRDAFYVMRTAQAAFPGSPITRRIQSEAAATFERLFLDGTADAMPAIEALSLFYDFRELTPIGRRGDEMIRRLADRLVAVDLLGQAAELLQHQVDNRLQGAARAQVASRLAVIYLMNRKPDRALQVLRSTRSADLSTELRNQRLLLEARAVSDSGRHDLALEVIANLNGREVDRLRADILWSARRWREAAEQIENLYGERWREFTPLTDTERPDILRAGIGYALAEDQLGLDRLREKYGPKMAEGPLAHAFDVVITPFSTNTPEFRSIAKAAAAADTLEQFLRDMRARYPETGVAPPAPLPPAPERQSQKPQAPRKARAAAGGQLAAVP
jgi:tetratricopeptide (TPR) repeat protein